VPLGRDRPPFVEHTDRFPEANRRAPFLDGDLARRSARAATGPTTHADLLASCDSSGTATPRVYDDGKRHVRATFIDTRIAGTPVPMRAELPRSL
jgi:hypothetical protein